MTETEKEIQELRRQVAKLKLENEELKQMHYCDQAEIIYQRRQIDFLLEGGDVQAPD